MEKDNTNLNIVLPYDKLRLIGIDRNAADNLPENVRQSLAKGEVTPLLQVDIKTRNGQIVTMPLRLQLAEGKNGEPMLMAYPVRRDISEETSLKYNLSERDRERLMKGEVLMKEIERDGRRQNLYFQLDPQTKSILNKPIAEVKLEQRLKDMEKINDIELGVQQKQAAREGKPIELNVGGEKVTVGVDLQEPQNFKIVQGDMKEWDRQMQMKYDLAHPEYVGLVQTEQNRWEQKQIIDKQSTERAIKLGAPERQNVSKGLKI